MFFVVVISSFAMTESGGDGRASGAMGGGDELSQSMKDQVALTYQVIHHDCRPVLEFGIVRLVNCYHAMLFVMFRVSITGRFICKIVWFIQWLSVFVGIMWSTVCQSFLCVIHTHILTLYYFPLLTLSTPTFFNTLGVF